MSFVSLYHCKKIVLVLIGISLSVFRFLLTLFRFQGNRISVKNDFENGEAISNENVEEECDLMREKEKNDTWDSSNGVEEKFESCFTFKFPAFDEFIKSKTEKGDCFCSDFVYTPVNRYEFSCRQSVRHFVEEKQLKQAVNLGVKHIYGDSCDSLFDEHKEIEHNKHADGISNKVLNDEQNTENSEIADKDDKFLRNQDLEDEKNSLGDHTVNSHWDGFLSDGDFVEQFEEPNKDLNQEKSTNNIVDERFSNADFLSEEHFQEDCVNSVAKDSCDFGDDDNKLESLWEHQELIEQLKMELKKVRATGLPTILEESESSPKISVDLKPWKIDETFQHEDCMDELHKFYKIYTERMRKLDVFNYQKMYAIGFLGLKDPFQSIPRPKTSTEMLKSKLSENFRQQRHKNTNKIDPMEKFIKELQSELEVVYVGQMCLSWELLHWQYKKALDLSESDPRGFHGYNVVAGEFQQFQVLLQRFIEDEAFQGPRVQYYIKNRCVNRKLLQVPLIREDGYGNRRNKRKWKRSENVITSYELVEIIEESIRILWRFIRADKDTCRSLMMSKGSPMQQLQNPADFELLKHIKNLHLKKEKKLKELRSGKCILKRLRTCREEEEDSNQVLYRFFSLVDIKLVYRVLNMLKLTNEQLVWCHTILNRINFEATTGGILPVDCSFMPFPC